MLVLAFTCVTLGLPIHHADQHVTSKPSIRESKDIKSSSGDGVIVKFVEYEPGLFHFIELINKASLDEPSTTMTPSSSDDQIFSPSTNSDSETEHQDPPGSSGVNQRLTKAIQESSSPTDHLRHDLNALIKETKPKLQKQQIQIQSQQATEDSSNRKYVGLLQRTVAPLRSHPKVDNSDVQELPVISAPSMQKLQKKETPEAKESVTSQSHRRTLKYVLASTFRMSSPMTVPEISDESSFGHQSDDVLHREEAPEMDNERVVPQPSLGTLEDSAPKHQTDLLTTQMPYDIEHEAKSGPMTKERTHEKELQYEQFTTIISPAIQLLSHPSPTAQVRETTQSSAPPSSPSGRRQARRQHGRRFLVDALEILRDRLIERKRILVKEREDREAARKNEQINPIMREDQVEDPEDETIRDSYETNSDVKFDQLTENDPLDDPVYRTVVG